MDDRHLTSAASACFVACAMFMPLLKQVAKSMAVSSSEMLFWMLFAEFKDDWRNDGKMGMASSTAEEMITHVHPSEMARQIASDFGWVLDSEDGPVKPCSMQRRYATVWLPPMVK